MVKFAAPLCHSKHIAFTLESNGVSERLLMPGEVRQLFKEDVNNMIKYAEASTCHTNLYILDHLFILEISDNGRGFDGLIKGIGNGCKNMKKRCEDLNGSFKIDSTFAQGNIVEVRLPYPFKSKNNRS